MKTFLAASLSALALAGCASSPTPREASSAWSEGYTERALSANRYLISYRMNGSDYQRAYDLALQRAAQIALDKGYPAFEVVSRDSDTDAGARSSFGVSTHHATTYQRSCGLLTCTTYATPTTWHGVKTRTDGRSVSRVVSLEVMLTQESAGNAPNRYDAAVLANGPSRP